MMDINAFKLPLSVERLKEFGRRRYVALSQFLVLYNRPGHQATPRVLTPTRSWWNAQWFRRSVGGVLIVVGSSGALFGMGCLIFDGAVGGVVCFLICGSAGSAGWYLLLTDRREVRGSGRTGVR